MSTVDFIIELFCRVDDRMVGAGKHSKRIWAYFETRLAFTVAIVNLLVQWHGLQPDEDGFVFLSIAEFSL